METGVTIAAAAPPFARAGDFSGLADDYARYRPAYAPAVIARVLAMTGKPAAAIDAADVGAGTGICARMLAQAGVRNIVAIEPNEDMRERGRQASCGDTIAWRAGSGEHTGLPAACLDLLCMATAFHWIDFAAGTGEAARVLRPGGLFVAMWNPRVLDADPLMREIEAKLTALRGRPTARSGNQLDAQALSAALLGNGHFTAVDYLEDEQAIDYAAAHFLGLMRSVNHLRVDLGAAGLAHFLGWLEQRIAPLETVTARYRTRAWVARTAQ